jgi:hypothetical protein
VKAVHYVNAGATACGTGGRKACTTTDPGAVTCRKCPTTLRWGMWVHGLSYTDAAILTTAARRMATTTARQPAA